MMQNENTLPVILVAEDDSDDQDLLMDCLETLKSPVAIEIVSNGLEVIERLHDKKKPHPCLVVLDINMPMLDGLETLKLIREETSLKSLPVVMFTTGAYEDNRSKALSLGANDYFIKPVQLKEWLASAGDMIKYCA